MSIKNSGMISNSLVNNPVAVTIPAVNRLNVDSQTAAFLDGVRAQQVVGAEQLKLNRDDEIEHQAHAQANKQARSSGELMGLNQAETAQLLRDKSQTIVELLRNPSFKLGRSR